MSADVEFTVEKGTRQDHDLTVYALSTCGFCKRALKFLRDNSIAFKYVYIDQIPFDVKQRVKNELKDKYDRSVYFPFLVIDGKDALVGFTEDEWRTALGVGA